MKPILIFLFLFALSINGNAQKYSKPRGTIIYGVVYNRQDDKMKVKLSINQMGLPAKQLSTTVDREGKFIFKFEIFTPTDCFVNYNNNAYLVLIHPGDSTYAELDGFFDCFKFPPLVCNIGDAATANRDIRYFQIYYFANPFYTKPSASMEQMKKYELEQYKLYLDTLKQHNKLIYDYFIKYRSPCEEAKRWAKVYLDRVYQSALSQYPDQYRYSNNLKKKDWDVPLNYYDEMMSFLPITESMFISCNSLNQFITDYHYNYIKKKVWAEESNKKYITEKGNIAPRHVMDSLAVYGILKHTQDNLLRQMELLDLFSREFQSLQVEHFEAYRDVFDAYVKEPYLREPFLELYAQTKEKIKQKH